MAVRERRGGLVAMLLLLLTRLALPGAGVRYVHVEVAGAAGVRYAGSPPVEQPVSGAARVQRLPTIAI